MNLLLILLYSVVLTMIVPTVGLCEKPKIGIIIPMTGRAAVAGETVRNSITLANSDLGEPFELLFEDNSLENTRTVTLARNLIQINEAKALIVYGSGPSNAAAPLAEQARIPMIGLAVDPHVSEGRTWVMIHWASPNNVVEQLIAELKRRKLARIAILSSQVEGILDIEKAFLDRAKAANLDVVFGQQVLPSETDFRTLIAKVKAAKPDGVFLNLYFGQVGVFASQSRAGHLTTQFFGQFALDNDAEVMASRGALNGAFFATTAVGDLSFDRSYLKNFGRSPALGGISAYDVVHILDGAFRGNPNDLEVVNNSIHTIANFSGKIGVYGVTANNSFNVPAGLGEIIDNRVIKNSIEPSFSN